MIAAGLLWPATFHYRTKREGIDAKHKERTDDRPSHAEACSTVAPQHFALGQFPCQRPVSNQRGEGTLPTTLFLQYCGVTTSQLRRRTHCSAPSSSARRSETSSTPTDNLINPPLIPSRLRLTTGTEA